MCPCLDATIELNGTYYRNNSEIAITEVGEEDNALKCRTDLNTCCSHFNPGQSRGGEWRYPNNSLVGYISSGDIYRDRGSMVVSLYRRNATQPTGLYCCEVPTAADPNATIILCIHLGK